MSARLVIPDNLVGKYVQHRFTATKCCLFEEVKQQIIECMKQQFPESTVQILSKEFQNDTITIDNDTEISCVSDRPCLFELDVQSISRDNTECATMLNCIKNTLQFMEQSEGKLIILYTHNLY